MQERRRSWYVVWAWLPVLSSSKPPLFQDTWPCVQLVCGAQCSMPVRLSHWQNQTSNVCSGMTGQWSDRSATSGHMIQWATCAAWHWGSGPHSEGEKAHWYGHVEHSNGAVKTAFHIQAEGKSGPGRPKMTWKQLTERECREWKLSAINPHDRNMWRSGVRPAMHAASQLSGRGPTMWMLPLYLHVNKKSDYDMIWFYHTWAWQPSCLMMQNRMNKLIIPLQQKAKRETWWKLVKAFLKKTFKNYEILNMYITKGNGSEHDCI